jgi:hypothetical protein
MLKTVQGTASSSSPRLISGAGATNYSSAFDRRSSMDDVATVWPDLPYASWRETASTLQLWTQIAGKVRLTLTPWLNHGWQVPLYVTARGLSTSPIPIDNEILEIEFDFINHRLVARTSRGEENALPLEPQTVADFYLRVTDLLNRIGVMVTINEMPNEVPSRSAFRRTASTPAMTPPQPIGSGGRSFRSITSSSSSAAAS